MPLAITLASVKQIKLPTMVAVLGLVVPSGTYPTGGDPFITELNKIRTLTQAPLKFLAFFGKNGFVYQWDGSVSAPKFMVYTNTAGGANAALGEHTNATYVAGVSGDTIYFLALFGN